MKKAALFLALAMILTWVPALPASAQMVSEAEFAVLVYMCGTDLESRYGSATSDLSEMINAGMPADGSVCALVQTGGAKQWQNDVVPQDHTERFLITDQLYSLNAGLSQLDMGAPETLQDFLTFAFENLPAKRYGLVLWDHGSGSTGGVCYDERTKHALSNEDVRNAISGAVRGRNIQFDFIGFDACLMATYSMAETLKPFTHYIYASEELEPGSGWSYDRVLDSLGKKASMPADQLGTVVVDSFIQSALSANPNDYVTMSVIDTAKLDALRQAVDGFGKAMKGQLDAGNFAKISRARAGMRAFGEYANAETDMIDIQTLAVGCKEIVPNEARVLYNAVQDAVIYHMSSAAEKSTCGMSILVPYRTAGSASAYLGSYDAQNTTPDYDAFIKAYVNQMQGGSYNFTPGQVQTVQVNGSSEADQDWISELLSGNDSGMGTGGVLSQLLGGLGETSSSTSGQSTGGTLEDLLGGLLGGGDANDSVQTQSGTGSAIEGALGSLLGGGGGGLLGDLFGSGSDNGEYGSMQADQMQTVDDDWNEATQTDTGLTQNHYESIVANHSAYAVQLSQSDLQNLSYVEASLMIAAPDQFKQEYGDTTFFDLGRTQNVHVDWESGQVRGLFNGNWPTLNGRMVPMIDQTVTQDYVRSAIPALINDKQQYVVVAFNKENPGGVIVGYSEGYDENGNPARGYQSFKQGDVVAPIYNLIYWDQNGTQQQEPFVGENIILDQAGLTFSYAPVESGDYYYCFVLNDVYGGTHYTDFTQMEF